VELLGDGEAPEDAFGSRDVFGSQGSGPVVAVLAHVGGVGQEPGVFFSEAEGQFAEGESPEKVFEGLEGVDGDGRDEVGEFEGFHGGCSCFLAARRGASGYGMRWVRPRLPSSRRVLGLPRCSGGEIIRVAVWCQEINVGILLTFPGVRHIIFQDGFARRVGGARKNKRQQKGAFAYVDQASFPSRGFGLCGFAQAGCFGS